MKPLSHLWKRVTSRSIALLNAHRVGGTGANHKGSHWLRVGATALADLPDHGARPSLVLSQTPNQVKVFTPSLGTFGVHRSRLAPADEGDTLEWNRREAQQTVPAPGSLVNVSGSGTTSQWMARLSDSLDGKEPHERVQLERGSPGRPLQLLSVRASDIVGPHIPTKIKTLDGEWVKDALRRRSAAPSPLDERVPRAVLEQTASALEWPAFLPPEQQNEMFEAERLWFQKHEAQVRQMARGQAARLRLRRADAEEVETEAVRGALAALRLWAKAPDAARRMTRNKLARDFPPMEGNAPLDDEELKTQRALWRAFAHARAASLSFLPKVAPPSRLQEAQPMNSSLTLQSSFDLDSSLTPDSPANAALAALAPVADAANLSGAARFLLLHALRMGNDGHVPLATDGAPWPTVEGEEVASKLRELFGVTNAAVDTLPGMWLFVRNRLSDAVRADPTLFPGANDPLVKSVLALQLDATASIWAARATSLFKSFDHFQPEFHEWQHPRSHGHFRQKLFHHEPAPMMFAAHGGGGSSSPSPAPSPTVPIFVGSNTQSSSHNYALDRPSWDFVKAGYATSLARSVLFAQPEEGEEFYRLLIGTSVVALGNVDVHFTQASFNHIFQNHPVNDREQRARMARLIPLTLQQPTEVWQDPDGTLRYVAFYEIRPATSHQQLKEVSIMDVVKIHQGRIVPDLTTMFPMTGNNQVENRVRAGKLLYATWRGDSIDPDAGSAP